MEAAIRRSRWSALALTLTLVSIALVPASAAEADLRPTRLALGLHEMPHVLAEGDVYDGATIVRVIPEIGVLAVLTREPTTFAQRQLADPNVRYVVNDDPRPLLLDDRVEEPPRLLLTPNDPQYGSMYGPQQVRADLAWNTATGDMDAAVCVIDTGVRRTHEDLGTARYLGGYDYVNNDADPADDQGHGTHVAGTAAASVNNNLGIAGMGNVGYYAVKVLDSGGYGSWSNVAAGITWCANNGIPRTVLSLSLGGSGSDPSVDSAIHYAFATKGMLVVAASGNGYCSNCVAYPGRHPEAIGVACTNSVVASCAFTSKGPEVDIAAPGEGIVSTCHSSDTAYCTMSGTSMSTPHVSGILALVWSHETTLNATALWQRLNETAKDIGTAGKDSTFGWGRIDAECLITNTLCSLPPAPPPATKNVFLESFESGLSGWTLTGLWHTSACRAASPVTSLAYNHPGSCSTNYDTGGTNAGEATSPPLAVPADATYARLRLSSWYVTESSTAYDKKTVLLSVNNGTFSAVHVESGPASTWNAIDIDLAAHVGKAVRVKLRFDTVDSLYNNYEGWYVDDIRIAVDLNATLPPATLVPGIPLASAATGSNGGEISLSWTAPSDGGSPITHYTVYRAASATGTYSPIATTAGLSHLDTGLGNGVTRFYKVSATNVAGEGMLSAAVNATTLNVPNAPVIAVQSGPDRGQLRVAWLPPPDGGSPITGYAVHRSESASGPYVLLGTTTATAWTDAGLADGVARWYKVRATNALGDGPLSSGVNGTTFALPGAPASPIAKPGPGVGEIRVSWNAPLQNGGTPVTSYRVYRADSVDGTYVLLGTSSALSYTDGGLPNGTRYWYRVSATNLVGEGAPTASVDARTFTRPSAPQNVVARPGSQLLSVDVTWQLPADNGGVNVSGFRVYRDGVLVASTSALSFRDTGLDPTRVYSYRVAAVNVVGEGNASAPDCARPAPWPEHALLASCALALTTLHADVPLQGRGEEGARREA